MKSPCAPTLFLTLIVLISPSVLPEALASMDEKESNDYKIVIAIQNEGTILVNATAFVSNATLSGGYLTFHAWITKGDDPFFMHSKKFVLSRWNLSSVAIKDVSSCQDKNLSNDGACDLKSTSDLESEEIRENNREIATTISVVHRNAGVAPTSWAIAITEVIKIVNKFVVVILVFLVVADVVWGCVSQRRTRTESTDN